MYEASSTYEPTQKRLAKISGRTYVESAGTLVVGDYRVTLKDMVYDRGYTSDNEPLSEAGEAFVCQELHSLKSRGSPLDGICVYGADGKLVAITVSTEMTTAIAEFWCEVSQADEECFRNWPYTLVSVVNVMHDVTDKKSKRKEKINRLELFTATFHQQKAAVAVTKAYDDYLLLGTLEGNSQITDADGLTTFTLSAKTRGEPVEVQNGMGIYLKVYG